MIAFIRWVPTLRVWTPPLRVQINMTSFFPTNHLSHRRPNKWVKAGCPIYNPWFLNLTVFKEFTRYIIWWQRLGADRYEPISRIIIWCSADWAGWQVVGSLLLLCVIPTLFTLIDIKSMHAVKFRKDTLFNRHLCFISIQREVSQTTHRGYDIKNDAHVGTCNFQLHIGYYTSGSGR